jgi:D-alanyl-lipoteichoic acid acyltransferase DltB (MBOAT superfamily)
LDLSYTFQTINYTVDVYRRHIRPTRNLVEFAAFVSFFPHLVAGPIMRASDLLPQFEAPRRVTVAGVREGAFLILYGLIQKIVIADALAPVADRGFGASPPGSSLSVALGVYAFWAIRRWAGTWISH